MNPGGSVLHASAVVVGEAGILIRGGSGAGKSALARDLVSEAERTGGFARLVGDDRVVVARVNGRLVVRPVAAVAGMIEVRGVGLVRVRHEPAAILRLVVDLDEAAIRLPEPSGLFAAIGDVTLPRIAVNAASALRVTSWRLGCLDDTLVSDC